MRKLTTSEVSRAAVREARRQIDAKYNAAYKVHSAAEKLYNTLRTKLFRMQYAVFGRRCQATRTKFSQAAVKAFAPLGLIVTKVTLEHNYLHIDFCNSEDELLLKKQVNRARLDFEATKKPYDDAYTEWANSKDRILNPETLKKTISPTMAKSMQRLVRMVNAKLTCKK